MATLEQCVRGRHSTRFYKDDPVPLDILRECLELAQLAPSNSNIQNWRMALATGQARDRIVEALKVRNSTCTASHRSDSRKGSSGQKWPKRSTATQAVHALPE